MWKPVSEAFLQPLYERQYFLVLKNSSKLFTHIKE